MQPSIFMCPFQYDLTLKNYFASLSVFKKILIKNAFIS